MVRCWCGYLSGARCRLAHAQLMPLPLTISCSSKIQIGCTFLVPAHPGSPGQRAFKRVCVCILLHKVLNTYQNSIHRIVANTFLNVCEKFTSFCQALKRCTQKKVGSFFLPHGTDSYELTVVYHLMAYNSGLTNQW